MAEGCLAILNDPQLSSNMGKAAREHARHNFCASKIVVQYEDLYHHTIQQAHTVK